MTATDVEVVGLAAELADRARSEMEQLVAVSSPSGDLAGAEAALALCRAFLPENAQAERVPCSTPSCAPDLLARIPGRGRRRVLLLGHVDTVVPHGDHAELRLEGDRLYGPGTADMKGGVALSLAVARALAPAPERFAELGVLLVCDEEWRTKPFGHVERFAGYDACLCFEAGERSAEGHEGVVVRRKGAGTLRVTGRGSAAHSGSAPDQGRNALLALSRVAVEVSRWHDPSGPDRLTVVPTVMRSGRALNVVPASGELICDLRADDTGAFQRVLESVGTERDGVELEASMERVWPAMDSERETARLLVAAADRLGRPIVPRRRGGASDASHFAPSIPLTVDGLGPRGGGAHTPGEYVLRESLRERLAVALALALAVLNS